MSQSIQVCMSDVADLKIKMAAVLDGCLKQRAAIEL